MATQVIGISNNKDMLSKKRVVVESLHTVEWTKYIPAGKKTANLFKLIGKDFEAFETRYGIPEGTISRDTQTINALSLRTRFSNGYALIFHLENGNEFDFDTAEEYLNALPEEDLRRLIAEARL